MVALAARATLYAQPTPTPQRIVVTEVVVVTQIVVVTATPTLPETPTPDLTATDTAATDTAVTDTAVTDTAVTDTAVTDTAATDTAATATAPPTATSAPIVTPTPATDIVETAPRTVAASAGDACPASSPHQYAAVPVAGGRLDHPPAQHADLRLSLRGYQPIEAARTLIDKDGPVDGDPPQLAGLFSDNRAPHFGQPYRVYDWDWGCAAHGCRGAILEAPQVTLIALHMHAGESVHIPRRNQQIYGGGYKALVLYAEPTRITLGYTREDSVANGYAVHIENVCVDPNLLILYTSSDAGGRASLPALREDESLGVAALGEPLVAVRDRGAFLDPRSQLDWWQEK